MSISCTKSSVSCAPKPTRTRRAASDRRRAVATSLSMRSYTTASPRRSARMASAQCCSRSSTVICSALAVPRMRNSDHSPVSRLRKLHSSEGRIGAHCDAFKERRRKRPTRDSRNFFEYALICDGFAAALRVHGLCPALLALFHAHLFGSCCPDLTIRPSHQKLGSHPRESVAKAAFHPKNAFEHVATEGSKCAKLRYWICRQRPPSNE